MDYQRTSKYLFTIPKIATLKDRWILFFCLIIIEIIEIISIWVYSHMRQMRVQISFIQLIPMKLNVEIWFRSLMRCNVYSMNRGKVWCLRPEGTRLKWSLIEWSNAKNKRWLLRTWYVHEVQSGTFVNTSHWWTGNPFQFIINLCPIYHECTWWDNNNNNSGGSSSSSNGNQKPILGLFECHGDACQLVQRSDEK